MTIQDKIDGIEQGANYVSGSLTMETYYDSGCIISWLESNAQNTADFRKKFFETDPDARDSGGMKITIYDRDVLSEIFIEGSSSIIKTKAVDDSGNTAALNYKISDIDDSGSTSYYGYVTSGGDWYILEEDSTNDVYRYAKGDSGYSTAWTNRASQNYNYYDVEF